jgi:hypothetical protein
MLLLLLPLMMMILLLVQLELVLLLLLVLLILLLVLLLLVLLKMVGLCLKLCSCHRGGGSACWSRPPHALPRVTGEAKAHAARTRLHPLALHF